jgi:hypothetical protein
MTIGMEDVPNGLVVGTAVGGTAVGGTLVGCGTAVGGTAVGVAAVPHAVISMTAATINETNTKTFFIFFFSSQGNRVLGTVPSDKKIIYLNPKKCK